jgi:hypothetical protein
MLTAEQIKENWDTHLEYINKFLAKDPRKEAILQLYKDYEEVAMLAPASSKTWFHNAFPGGYIDHVNRVVSTAIQIAKLWKTTMGGILDFTQEELIFSALFHDLGKLGMSGKPNYLPQTDNWRKDKLQEVYTQNVELDFMLIPDRSLFILQSNNIPVSKNEYLAIRLHDGVFDDANKAYFFSHQPSSKLRTNLVHILHMADYMASKVEVDLYKQSLEALTVVKK